MKKIILIAAAAMLALPSFAQPAQTQTAPYENYIQVTGKAEREITPDEIYVRIVISEENLKNKQSVERMEQDMIARLKSIGVDTDRDLKVDNLSSSYKNYVFNKNNPKTTAAYQLKVNGAAMLSRVYQAMESLGISNMNIVKLSHSDMKGIQKEIRMEAMANAQEVARSLAEAVGQSAGRAVYIVDYNADVAVPYLRNDVMLARSASADSPAYETELDFKEIKITYTVTAKFELN